MSSITSPSALSARASARSGRRRPTTVVTGRQGDAQAREVGRPGRPAGSRRRARSGRSPGRCRRHRPTKSYRLGDLGRAEAARPSRSGRAGACARPRVAVPAGSGGSLEDPEVGRAWGRSSSPKTPSMIDAEPAGTRIGPVRPRTRAALEPGKRRRSTPNAAASRAAGPATTIRRSAGCRRRRPRDRARGRMPRPARSRPDPRRGRRCAARSRLRWPGGRHRGGPRRRERCRDGRPAAANPADRQLDPFVGRHRARASRASGIGCPDAAARGRPGARSRARRSLRPGCVEDAGRPVGSDPGPAVRASWPRLRPGAAAVYGEDDLGPVRAGAGRWCGRAVRLGAAGVRWLPGWPNSGTGSRRHAQGVEASRRWPGCPRAVIVMPDLQVGDRRLGHRRRPGRSSSR